MPTITRITEQKRRANRRSVYLDGAFAFGCNVNVIARFRLSEGMQLTPEQVTGIQLGAVKQECFDDAMRSLERRLHSRAELQRKLLPKEYGETVVAAVLAWEDEDERGSAPANAEPSGTICSVGK